MMRSAATRPAAPLAALLVTAMLAGPRPTRAAAAFDADQSDHQTRTLTLGAAGSLDISNVSGNVVVTAGSGTDTRVEVTRHARAGSDADARAALGGVTVTVDQQGTRGRVAVDYPKSEGRRNYSVDVTFAITTPPGTRVSVKTVSGSVRVERITGELTLAATSGDVTVTGAGAAIDAKSISGNIAISDAATHDAVAASTVSGDVRLARVTAKSLEAETTSGEVTADAMTADRASLTSLSGEVTYAGAVSRGGRYELKSHSGNVTFTPSGPVGFQLQAATFSGRIVAPGADMAVKSRSSASNLQTTVGDGSATVSLMAFSGNVTVGGRR